MKTLTAKLADYLEVDGWDIAESLTDDLQWWADEIWQLRSRWPSWRGNRRKGEGVCAIGCSTTFPRDRKEATGGDTLSLRASKAKIEEFVEVIASFRKLHRNV